MRNHTAAPNTGATLVAIVPILMDRDFTPAEAPEAGALWFDRTAADGRRVCVVLSDDDWTAITVYGFAGGQPGPAVFTLTCEGAPAMLAAIVDTALTHLA